MRTLAELRRWAEDAPPGTMIPAETVADALAEIEDDQAPVPAVEPEEATWAEKLWTAPEDQRIGVRELAEALGRSRSWVYKRTGPSAGSNRLPVRKLDGEVSFRVGEVRTWVRRSEEIEHALPTDPGLSVVRGGS